MKAIFGLGAILIAVISIYAQILTAPALTWDDGSNIFNNPFYNMHMWWGVWTNVYYGLYVPVTSTVWAFFFWLGGGQAWPFHALNLFLHMVNVVFVYRLLKGLAGRWQLRSEYAVPLATTLFALHPLQVEAVAWISGGRDLLSTFFALAATAVYFSSPSRKKFLAATALFVLGLFSKPSVTVLPLGILFLDIFLGERTLRSSLKRMSVWIAFSFVAIFLTVVAQGEHFANQVALWLRPVVVLDNFSFYAEKLIWPLQLSGNYGYTPEHALADGWLRPLLGASVLAFALFIAYRYNRRYLIGFLALVLILPASGIIPFGFEQISGVADHYLYLPLAALAAVMLLICAKLEQNKIFLVLPLMLAAFWTATSFARVSVWSSDLNFFSDMAKTSPNAYSTALGMSVVMCEDVKDYNEGLRWIDRALAAKPDDILALANRAFCLLNSNRNQEVIAMDFYLDRLPYDEMSATQPTAYSSLVSSIGTAMIKEEDFAMGYQYLCEAYRILPSEPNHVNNLNAAAEILEAHGINPKCEDISKASEQPE